MYKEHMVTLGGVRQRIGVEVHRSDAPIMLMLHGGPWMPVLYGMAYHGRYPQLARRYTLIWWDQCGCGRNAGCVSDRVASRMTVRTMARMTVDLVDVIGRMFPGAPIVLNGYSFGTYLTMVAAWARADAIAAVVNVAPVLDLATLSDAGKKTRAVIWRRRRMDDPTVFYARYRRAVSAAKRHARAPQAWWWLAPLAACAQYGWREYAAMMRVTVLEWTGAGIFRTMSRSLRWVDVRRYAYATRVPTLYVQGWQDWFAPANELHAIAETNRCVTFVRLPGWGHVPRRVDWRVVESVVVEYVDRAVENYRRRAGKAAKSSGDMGLS